MSEKKMTLGQAIDQIVDALEQLGQEARQTAIEAACNHLGLTTPTKQTSLGALPSASHPLPTKSASPQTDIRTLKDQKNPRSAAQMACLVAYYLQELAPAHERKQSVNTNDLTKYFKQAGFKLPKTISQLLPDTRARGYFESGPGKGEYTLNAVGYNLVAHNLPQSSEN